MRDSQQYDRSYGVHPFHGHSTLGKSRLPDGGFDLTGDAEVCHSSPGYFNCSTLHDVPWRCVPSWNPRIASMGLDMDGLTQ